MNKKPSENSGFRPFTTLSTNSFNAKASQSNQKQKHDCSSKVTPTSKSEFQSTINRFSQTPNDKTITNRQSFGSNHSGSVFVSKSFHPKIISNSLKKGSGLNGSDNKSFPAMMLKLLETPENSKKRTSLESYYSRNGNKEEDTFNNECSLNLEAETNYATPYDAIMDGYLSKEKELQNTIFKIEKGISEGEEVKVRLCFMNMIKRTKDPKKIAQFIRQSGATINEMMVYNDLYSNDPTLHDMKTTVLLNAENHHSIVSTTLKYIRNELKIVKNFLRRGSKILLVHTETPILDSDTIMQNSYTENVLVKGNSDCICSGRKEIRNPSMNEEKICLNSIPFKIAKHKDLIISNILKGVTSFAIEEYSDLALKNLYVFFVKRSRTWGFYFIPRFSEEIWDYYVPILMEKEDGKLIEFSLNPMNEISKSCIMLLEEYDNILSKQYEEEKSEYDKNIQNIKAEIEKIDTTWSKGYGLLSLLHPVDYMQDSFQRANLNLKLEKLLKKQSKC